MSVFMMVCLRIAITQRKLVVVDTAWGPGFIVIALAAVACSLGASADPALRWPVMVGINTDHPKMWLVTLGIAVWAAGMFFETVGDAQLAAFKKDPTHKGKLMDQGLWRYTRHPNYFGDACVWWGIWLVAASSWAGIATIIGPIAMTLFLTRVTGKALNEKGMSASKPGYATYVARTSGFIPMPPKR